jgi:WD40 repeat protein
VKKLIKPFKYYDEFILSINKEEKENLVVLSDKSDIFFDAIDNLIESSLNIKSEIKNKIEIFKSDIFDKIKIVNHEWKVRKSIYEIIFVSVFDDLERVRGLDYFSLNILNKFTNFFHSSVSVNVKETNLFTKQKVEKLLDELDNLINIIKFENKKKNACERILIKFLFKNNKNYKNIKCIDSIKTQEISHLAVLDYETFASAAHKSGKIIIWARNSENKYKISNKISCLGVKCILSINDNLFISGSSNSIIRVWKKDTNSDNEQYKCMSTVSVSSGEINCLLRVSDGSIAVATGDGSIVILSEDEKNSYFVVSHLIGHFKSVICLVESNDGSIVSGSNDNTIRIWRLQTNYDYISTQTLKGLEGSVWALLALPDGKIISGSHISACIKIWEINLNGVYNCVFTLNIHNFAVSSLLLLPDGRVASGSFDNTIKIIQENTLNGEWKLDLTLQDHTDSVKSIILLSPKGQIASASIDGEIKIWS